MWSAEKLIQEPPPGEEACRPCYVPKTW
eukprot:COSAG06_NODE_34250_length_477_cov_1.079365_1_plen_27_part_10